MNREQMAERLQAEAVDILGWDPQDGLPLTLVQCSAILDVVLPTVPTVEELDRLPVQSVVLIDDTDSALTFYRIVRAGTAGWYHDGIGWLSSLDLIADWGSPTVVWTPGEQP